MKRFLTSYALSLPMVLLGIICLIQASNSSLTVVADTINDNKISSSKVLLGVGISLFVLGFISIIIKNITKEKR